MGVGGVLLGIREKRGGGNCGECNVYYSLFFFFSWLFTFTYDV